MRVVLSSYRRRPPTCPICGAPFTICTVHAQGALAVPVSMPGALRARLAQATSAAQQQPDAATSPPFTTATYKRAEHNPLRRRRKVTR